MTVAERIDMGNVVFPVAHLPSLWCQSLRAARGCISWAAPLTPWSAVLRSSHRCAAGVSLQGQMGPPMVILVLPLSEVRWLRLTFPLLSEPWVRLDPLDPHREAPAHLLDEGDRGADRVVVVTLQEPIPGGRIDGAEPVEPPGAPFEVIPIPRDRRPAIRSSCRRWGPGR